MNFYNITTIDDDTFSDKASNLKQLLESYPCADLQFTTIEEIITKTNAHYTYMWNHKKEKWKKIDK